jgi:hypothetical protein
MYININHGHIIVNQDHIIVGRRRGGIAAVGSIVNPFHRSTALRNVVASYNGTGLNVVCSDIG